MKIFAAFILIGIMIPGMLFFEHKNDSGNLPKHIASPVPLKYYLVRDSIQNQKHSLYLKYQKLHSKNKKDSFLLHGGRSLFLSSLSVKLWPYWYGTPWAFYGYGDTPRVNYVACGYFVTILLRDAGAQVNIQELAEGTSGAMIEKLTSKSYIKKYNKVSPDRFFEAVRKDGDGLYITGLDNHTGFLLCEKGILYFIDSAPQTVQKRKAADNYLLVASQFRMTGKISDDPEFLRKWLSGEKFE